jgi:hypothetical protein
MSDVSVSDIVPASAWWPHGCTELNVHQLPEKEQLAIIPPGVIHVLTQQFNGWLGSIRLHLRHVEVVHKDHTALANWRTKLTLPSLVKLPIYNILNP